MEQLQNQVEESSKDSISTQDPPSFEELDELVVYGTLFSLLARDGAGDYYGCFPAIFSFAGQRLQAIYDRFLDVVVDHKANLKKSEVVSTPVSEGRKKELRELFNRAFSESDRTKEREKFFEELEKDEERFQAYLRSTEPQQDQEGKE